MPLCFWNATSIAAHNFSKLEAYIMKHNFDIICLSETYLEYYIQHDNKKLHLNGCKQATCDVDICCKDISATRQLESNNLNECLH